jgi:hypothetical protein
MKSRRFLDSRVGYLAAAVITLLGLATPALMTSTVSAAQLTNRSIQLSSANANDTNVSYKVGFTPGSSAGAVMITFCSDSPIPGQTCTAPSGFTAASAATTNGGTIETSIAANIIKYTKAGMSTAQSIDFTGIHNPTSANTSSVGFYARIVTYADNTYGGYTSPTAIGTAIDNGGVAMSINNPIQISAAVRETMTFCVSKAAPTADCTGTDTPSLTLGNGTPAALDAQHTDTAGAYTQISTNALSGAVVNMKIDNTCGGLVRVGASNVCDIAPVATGHSPITAGSAAKFGLNVGAGAAVGTGSGSVTAATNYATASEYGMNWVSGNATGVGSTYGDTIYSTAAAINNINVPLTFAATVTNTTPAGLYKANLSLIATGTY